MYKKLLSGVLAAAMVVGGATYAAQPQTAADAASAPKPKYTFSMNGASKKVVGVARKGDTASGGTGKTKPQRSVAQSFIFQTKLHGPHDLTHLPVVETGAGTPGGAVAALVAGGNVLAAFFFHFMKEARVPNLIEPDACHRVVLLVECCRPPRAKTGPRAGRNSGEGRTAS